MVGVDDILRRLQTHEGPEGASLVRRAYEFALKAHAPHRRESGEPYVSHPIAVAAILADMGLDSTSIATALLHDTIEDAGVSMEETRKLFGDDVARLVDGVTKLSRLEFQNDQQAKQAENFRKLILAMSEDIRVLLVKLADRLHNMSTLRGLADPERRRRIARETMDIYVPLAERIGLKQIQDDLQDLAFAELNPDARASVLTRLGYLRSSGGALVDTIRAELAEVLEKDGLKAEVTGREKSPYSIWRKMQHKNVAFEQLADIMAFRVLVDTTGACYQALGTLHSHYPVIPGRFKDYISTPKPNHYQSLHTGLMGPHHHRIEVQIRTHQMHDVNQWGVAAHWTYKHGGAPDQGQTEYRWLRELLDIVEHALKPDELLEHTRLELFQDQVFCFSPKGDLTALPRGASPVDFAYAVHSSLGDTCVGAKVNGRMVPLRTVLQNGDQVEVITQKGGHPSPAWERFVVTGKARASIRKFIRARQRNEYVTLGKALLEKVCRQEGTELVEKPFETVAKKLQASTFEDLLALIGSGLHSAREAFNVAFPGHKRAAEKAAASKQATKTAKTAPAASADRTSSPLLLRGLIPGMAVHFARCCHPLPGDPIVGIVATGRGVTIHTQDCETLETFRASPERWVDVGWGREYGKEASMVGRLSVVLTNHAHSLGALTTLIGREGGHITNLKITNRAPEFFDLIVDIEVRDLEHLSHIMAGLRASVAVNSVERAKGR